MAGKGRRESGTWMDMGRMEVEGRREGGTWTDKGIGWKWRGDVKVASGQTEG